jgi:hypothetical protein
MARGEPTYLWVNTIRRGMAAAIASRTIDEGLRLPPFHMKVWHCVIAMLVVSSCLDQPIGQRQGKPEGRASTRNTLDSHLPLVLFDDNLGDG